MSEVYEPVSLGSFCEAKFQICRKLYSDYYGKTSETGFRIQMMPPEHGQRQYDWHAFDWQRTPFPVLLDWLEKDFDGVFEREDLRVEGDFIMHRSGSEHSHQFHGFSSDWTEETLDRAYPSVRKAFERRVAQFRSLLTLPGPYLYVWTTSSQYEGTDRAPTVDQVRRLLDQLGGRSADHRFKLLIVANAGKDEDYAELGDGVAKAYRVEEVDKTPTMRWEGNDAAWRTILAPYALTLHGRETPPDAAPVETPPAAATGRGLFSRLLNR